MRSLGALLLIATVTLVGCRKDEPTDDVSGSGAVVDLTITVTTDDDADRTVMTLTCDPDGGDHPNIEAACSRLDEAGARIFDPIAADQACTMIYGGPQTATITGTYHGDEVDASFSRQNGCEIDRWDTLGTEVFDVPLQ